MTKSGLKLILLGILLFAVGGPLAKATDGMKGQTAEICIVASLILCFFALATFLYGLGKLILGLVKKA
ncbi:MAG TPA: hypothetical protein VKT78_01300 [Fimbriimonadaceae bacterium]|nr:hypothetical protein [Fimbriimonadaceae bacterium]